MPFTWNDLAQLTTGKPMPTFDMSVKSMGRQAVQRAFASPGTITRGQDVIPSPFPQTPGNTGLVQMDTPNLFPRKQQSESSIGEILQIAGALFGIGF